jgi:hypothetical protein
MAEDSELDVAAKNCSKAKEQALVYHAACTMYGIDVHTRAEFERRFTVPWSAHAARIARNERLDVIKCFLVKSVVDPKPNIKLHQERMSKMRWIKFDITQSI